MEDYGTPGATTLLMVNYGIGKVTTEFLVFPDVDYILKTPIPLPLPSQLVSPLGLLIPAVLRLLEEIANPRPTISRVSVGRIIPSSQRRAEA